MEVTIRPATRISGRRQVPGDKSISHRALIAAAMTDGPCRLTGLAPGADVASTRTCLEKLGYDFHGPAGAPGKEVILSGNGWRPHDRARLDAGNSGTTMRLLAGALAGVSGEYRLTGDASLSTRPMGRIADPLRAMGARVELSEGDRPPVMLKGGRLRGIEYDMPVASAQVKGAILLAGLLAEGKTKVIEPAASRDHTERLLEWLGAALRWTSGSVELEGGLEVFEHPGFEMSIPGDLSSAAFFLTAAILLNSGNIEIAEVGLNPSRTGIVEILKAMGAQIEAEVVRASPEPQGTITASSSRLKGIEIGGSLVPTAIDELPLVALAATQAEGTTIITDAAELRVKESDRIKTLAVALRALGASISELPGGWEIDGPTPLSGGRVNAAGDHRIALTMAVAGTIAREPVSIEGWECTQISYPGFDKELAGLVA